MQNPVPNAYTLAIAGRKPFVVVHTALLELLEPLEVQVRLTPRLFCEASMHKGEGHHARYVSCDFSLGSGFSVFENWTCALLHKKHVVQAGYKRWLIAHIKKTCSLKTFGTSIFLPCKANGQMGVLQSTLTFNQRGGALHKVTQAAPSSTLGSRVQYTLP